MENVKVDYAAAVGSGGFPWDMLRYDFCSPASEGKDCRGLDHIEWVGAIKGEPDTDPFPIRVIVLKRYRLAGRWTPARWESQGWKLVTWGEHGFETEEEAREAGRRLSLEILAKRRSATA